MSTVPLTVLLAAFLALLALAGTAWIILSPARRRAETALHDLEEARAALNRERQMRETLAVEHARLSADAGRVPQLEQVIAGLRDRLESTGGQLAETRATLESERREHEARLAELRRMGAEMERKFSVLAASALNSNSENFLKLLSERFDRHKADAQQDMDARRKAVEGLVAPIQESLSRFERQVDALEKNRIGAYQAISEQVKSLAEGQTGLRSETSRLVQALRQPKTRGRWGEFQLRNVLEMAGMTEHVDFAEEQTIPGGSGPDSRLRPDVIIRLPGAKSIVVDAKTPLESYLSAIDCTDEETRKQHVINHTRQLHAHVRALSSKEYWKSLPETPDFVVMFVPGEAFFAAAIETDPNLFEEATRQRVLISTPTTFIALVKAIAYGWQQENLAQNSRAVADLARDLYERIRVFGEHVGAMGQSLRQTVERYNRAVGSLEGRVLPAARKFETLGAAPAGSVLPPLAPLETEPRSPQAAELLADAPSGPPAPGAPDLPPPGKPAAG